MSSSASQQNHGLKRKRPPTFQHLPVQRAKKLKRSWVEVQKIKSKWKAQKRKEGLIVLRHQLDHPVGAGAGADEPNDRESGDDPEGDEGNELTSGFSDGSVGGAATQKSGDEEAGSDSASEGSSEDGKPGTLTAKSASSKRPNQPKSSQNGAQNSSNEQLSLRDLQGMAYSRASLHTHKSDPLHRHRGAATSRGRGGQGGGRGRGRGGSSSGESRGRGQGGMQRGRGRGQPDMGLRMKAMLEKIKQDFT